MMVVGGGGDGGLCVAFLSLLSLSLSTEFYRLEVGLLMSNQISFSLA